MRAFERQHLPATIVSVALLGLTISWYFGVHEFRLANASSKDGWSAAPLGWMFILVFSPVFSLIGIPMILRCRDRLSLLDISAILTAASPAILFLVLAAVALLRQCAS